MQIVKNDFDDDYFMEKALALAEKALFEGEFPVGCIIVYKNEIIATGSRTGTSGKDTNEIDHAEIVALRRFADLDSGIKDKSEITLYSTLEPCLMCYGAILLSGIGKIVYAYEDVMGGGTTCNLAKLNPLYKDRNITIIPDVLRQLSLGLFKEFFSSPDNRYWRGSLLEKYTLGL